MVAHWARYRGSLDGVVHVSVLCNDVLGLSEAVVPAGCVFDVVGFPMVIMLDTKK